MKRYLVNFFYFVFWRVHHVAGPSIGPRALQGFTSFQQFALTFPLPLEPLSLPISRIYWFVPSLTMLQVISIVAFVIWAIFPCIDTFSMLITVLKITFIFVSIGKLQQTKWIKLVIVKCAFISKLSIFISSFSMFAPIQKFPLIHYAFM